MVSSLDMPRSSANPFASIIGSLQGSSENASVNLREDTDKMKEIHEKVSTGPQKSSSQVGLQERKKTGSVDEPKVHIEAKKFGSDDLIAVASKLAGMSDLTTESILAFISEGSGRAASTDASTTSIEAPTVADTSDESMISLSPKVSRYSFGVGMGKGHNRLSTAGRESLDMRDFDLDEVKRHRLSIMSSQTPCLPTADSFPASLGRKQCEQEVNLLEYCKVGVDREVLAGKTPPDWMNYRQKAKVLDSYPTPCPLIENIHDYCFPQGVPLELLMQSQVASYSQAHHDRLHILSFQDAKGTPTFATVLTVVEIVPTSFTLPLKEVFRGDDPASAMWADKENGTLVAYLLMLEKRKKLRKLFYASLLKEARPCRVISLKKS